MSLLLTSPAYLLAIPALLRVLAAAHRGRGRRSRCCSSALVDLMHFSQGWVQFGYRFSNDFAPFAVILVALGIARAMRRGPGARSPCCSWRPRSLVNAWGVYWGVRLGW